MLISSLLGFSAFSSIFCIYVLTKPKLAAPRHIYNREELLQCRMQALEKVYADLAKSRAEA